MQGDLWSGLELWGEVEEKRGIEELGVYEYSKRDGGGGLAWCNVV
jgi:hypothetical protein